jgi:SAM-dependent methyltransferase
VPETTETASANNGKANFDDIYSSADPRAYCRVLSGLDYEIAAHGARAFRRVLDALPAPTGRRQRVLDLCCSYGFVGALLKNDVTLGDIYRRYAEAGDLSPADLAAADRAFYAGRPRPAPPEVAGLDLAGPAVRYACDAGILDAGFVENLETDPPSPALAAVAARADLITVTGGIGYITEHTLGALYAAAGDNPPWLAAFTLRMFPFDSIAELLARRGLVTERLSGATFPQRRFADDAERTHAFAQLASLGLDPAGVEEDGRYHAEFFLTRPAADAERLPLADLALAPAATVAG